MQGGAPGALAVQETQHPVHMQATVAGLHRHHWVGPDVISLGTVGSIVCVRVCVFVCKIGYIMIL